MSDQRNGPNAGPTAVSISTSATEAKVGASRLDERSVVVIQPTDGDVYYGFTSAVTTASGFKIPKGTYAELAFSDSVSVWLIASSSVDVRIAELS